MMTSFIKKKIIKARLERKKRENASNTEKLKKKIEKQAKMVLKKAKTLEFKSSDIV